MTFLKIFICVMIVDNELSNVNTDLKEHGIEETDYN